MLACESFPGAGATLGEMSLSLITDAPALELLDVFTVVMVGNFTLGGLPVAIHGLCNIDNVFLQVIIDF